MTAWCPGSGTLAVTTSNRQRCAHCGRRIVTVDGRIRRHRMPGQSGHCAECGAEFTQDREIGRPQLYCGRLCQGRAGERARQKRDAQRDVA